VGNERLRSSMVEAQVTVDDIAEIAEVDPKTVQRWLSGRRPYERHRWRVARLLGDDERYLWPPEEVGPGAAATCTQELVAVYAHRALLPPDTWWRLFERARDRIDLLGYAMLETRGDLDRMPRRHGLRADGADGDESKRPPGAQGES
jgi:transcriptional regulator with XRE-family HTH domain